MLTISGRAALLSLAACSAGSAAGTGVPSTANAGGFVAFAGNFAAYRSWPSLTVFDDGGAGGAVHTATELVEYINQEPDAGATPFPVGTLIVKEVPQGDPATRQAFAMAKRGGDYDSAGTVGWEWFELQSLNAAGDVQILWRGTAPPVGETYAGNVNGDCNTCHEKAPHDGVFAQ